jgi:hypothetical protein
MFNGDWTEQSPLGKAEWIKFFGAIRTRFKANSVFAKLKKNKLLWFCKKSDKKYSSVNSKINGTYHKATGGSISKR